MFYYPIDVETQLQLLESRHAEELFAPIDASRASLREWLPWVDANARAEHSRAFIESVRKQYAAEAGFTAGIWHLGRLTGVIGYHRIDRANRATSIGYWLGEPFQGRGLMTRACRALVDHALGDLQLHRIEIRCGVENVRSRAIPERLGFTNEGTLRDSERIGDRYVDHVVYGMPARQWEALRTAEGRA